MKSEQIEATFPLGHRLPEPIVSICEFLETHGYPISGCFELSEIGMEDVKDWFPDKPEISSQFLPFGRGACGDVYALWLHGSEIQPDTAPVVMFGSEGELPVLASSALEFCRLLCLGYAEIGLDDPLSEPRDYAETEPFRRFMSERFGFELPENAAPIIAEAESSVPNFAAFVEANQPC
jgi:hypothetical protein